MTNSLGIFSKIFTRPSLPGVLDAIVALSVNDIQFNLASAGIPTLPPAVDPAVVRSMGDAIRTARVRVAAVSGTFNLIDPDQERRQENLRRLGLLASICPAIECPIITLCSGTRDPDDMWREHPDNASPEAWEEMLESMRAALSITEPYNVTLAVEPEPGNVISTAAAARSLLDQVRDARLKILIDGANILAGQPERSQQEVLGEAFQLLSGDIALVHGKELPEVPMDWELYLRHVAMSRYEGPIILHGFDEEQAPAILGRLRAAQSPSIE